MTMTEGTAPPPPSAPPPDPTFIDTTYGFKPVQWVDPPEANGSPWFTTEQMCIRNANAAAYRQYGNKEQWERYTTLGYFAFDHCGDFDKLWSKMTTEPLQVHRAIWYNFMAHVDLAIEIPAKLNNWAMQFSHTYLNHFEPSSLEMDTTKYSFKSMPFDDAMDTDNLEERPWIPVSHRRRSKSPPKELLNNTGEEILIDKRTDQTNQVTQLPKNYRPLQGEPRTQTTKPPPNLVSTSESRINITTATEPVTAEASRNLDNTSTYPEATSHHRGHNKGTRNFAQKSHDDQSSKTPTPHANRSTNDGTHRVTVKWTTTANFREYETDKIKMNAAIYTMVQAMFPDDKGVLYRWESEDLLASKEPTKLTPMELRDYISPRITMIDSRSLLIFGLRVGFKEPPSVWRNSPVMQQLLKEKQLEITISNSTSTSGDMVTAGYILLKAPFTTHTLRYTQYIRGLLPDTTPYFDIVRRKKTPMDQAISHLVVQCGEKQVIPVCQALLTVLSGKGVALFIPRYALSTISDEKVKQHFLFHDKWIKSLKSLTLTPTITHLDQVRTEYLDDGTTLERSTREWVATLKAPDGVTPALCDATNGSRDQKAYLLVPGHYFDQAQQQLRLYKSHLYPPHHREARFRDNLPGLPDVITIQSEVFSNVSFLDQMSAEDVWKQAPPGVRTDNTSGNMTQPISAAAHHSSDTTHWPILPNQREAAQSKKGGKGTRRSHPLTEINEREEVTIDDTHSTTSTKSLTLGSQTTINPRFLELEALLKLQQIAMDESGRKTTERLATLETQFQRIEDLDTKMASIQSKQEETTQQMEKYQQETTTQFTEMKGSMMITMESQHRMSSTMLEMRDQFEKMSAFMVDLADKMGHMMNNPQQSKTNYTTNDTIVPRGSATKRSKQSASTLSVSSQSTRSSNASSHDSSVYRSPTKKKLRPRDNILVTGSEQTPPRQQITHPEEFETDDEQMSQQGVNTARSPTDEHEYDQMSDTSDVCLNLDEESLQQSTQPGSQLPAIRVAPIFTTALQRRLTSSTNESKAPLNPQYTKPKDAAGANKS